MNLLNKRVISTPIWELDMPWIVHLKDYNYSFESFIIKGKKQKL
jgi:hypothetical protein